MGDHRRARSATRSGERQRGRTRVRSLSECMKLRYERGALADLDEIFAYIAADNREAAGRLVTRLEHAAARIAASPHIGERHEASPAPAAHLQSEINSPYCVYENLMQPAMAGAT